MNIHDKNINFKFVTITLFWSFIRVYHQLPNNNMVQIYFASQRDELISKLIRYSNHIFGLPTLTINFFLAAEE